MRNPGLLVERFFCMELSVNSSLVSNFFFHSEVLHFQLNCIICFLFLFSLAVSTLSMEMRS